ncbi:alpha/beta fold hydrolase [Azospirillum rugosum]|uniref:Pimeloyl-ACP methyl ester carboxylesterase n=1 Tax=Azospirillum rugosum TaxID=416170 RepID=A0ABS4SG20_9PROT|nr:alpha/beta hydrolase [Azospirillum rugosum]MBP2291511.1 pimeloyl-ACP methyl ester carboxylesterase [Azospirillum rugosum]MDQ0525299.1 pimeloyl-ACP methyl ester carboxylesterase [Azospirillum rugosum]
MANTEQEAAPQPERCDRGGLRGGMVEVEPGVRLHVIDAGPADGPLVILLHGFPEFWYGWRRQVGALAAAGFRVLVPDQRGYGMSDKPPGIDSYTTDRLAADVLALADWAGCRTFSVVGHDWGGIVAWWVALVRLDRVARLVILNAPHPATVRPYALRHPTQAARSWYVLAFQLPRLPERMMAAHGFRMAERALLGTSRPGTFDADDLACYREAWGRPGALTAMVNWYRALRRGLRPPNARVRAPTLILWGDRDRFLEQGLAEAAAALCDDARVVHMEKASHWVQHEEAARVNRDLTAFLSGGRREA